MIEVHKSDEACHRHSSEAGSSSWIISLLAEKWKVTRAAKMSTELGLAEAGGELGELESDTDFWNYFNESVCDIPELQNITGTT